MSKEPASQSEIVLYQTEDGRTRLEVKLENETVWLTQGQMAELFQTTIPNVSMHIRNLFSDGELKPDSVVKESLTTAADGKKYQTRFFNLDVIISVGYRVKSLRGTQFRIWATQRLREYIVKGFTLDDERLKQGSGGISFQISLRSLRLNNHEPPRQRHRRPPEPAQTPKCIYMLEPKARNDMQDPEVIAKKDSAVRWCQHATEHSAKNGGKPWKYLLIPHDTIAENMSITGLAAQFTVG
jgi:hypothetical protein